MPITGLAAGAGDALARIIAQRREQQELEALIASREAALAESQRSSQADEAYRSRSLDIQEQNLAESRAIRQREREETQGQQAFMTQQPGRVDEPVAAKIRLNPAFGAMLKTSQVLPEAEGVGPLQEPETQRPELWDERQNRVTNERLLEGQRLTAEERAADNARLGGQYGRSQTESERHNRAMEAQAAAGLAARTTGRPPTGVQRTALGFYNRMKDALEDMDAVEKELNEKDVALINNSPLPDIINNPLLSSAGQQYTQALRTYTEARLRKESGAAIAPHEFSQDRMAISRQVGDKPGTLAQKQKTRRQTAKGIAFAAGPAYEEYYGEPLDLRDTDAQTDTTAGTQQKPIPGIPGGVAESTDGGKTWKRVK